jgi:thiol-disulfide isomerase/thioredoxin
MDRLPPLIGGVLLTLAALGCGRAEPTRTARYDAVPAPSGQSTMTQWCDVFHAGETGPAVALPALTPAGTDAVVPRLSPGRWTWINVWATWCVPCRREMPLLAAWRSRLAREGVPVDLLFLSIDENRADLATFLAEHRSVSPATVARLDGLAALRSWLKPYLGVEPDTIPIHLLVTPAGRLRCARVGALDESDWPTVRALLR